MSNRMALPLHFHIGTQRAGSTYLYNLLKAHPDISLSTFQEVSFYSNNFQRGTGWYADTFPQNGLRIDTSPVYFKMGHEVAPRIKAALQDQHPKFLVILRNPIDYVYSHYLMHLQNGFFKNNSDKYPEMPKKFIDFIERYPNYLERGCYYTILEKNWLSAFDPSQFKIIFFEEFTANTDHAIAEILSFFGVPPMKLTTLPSSKNKMFRYPLLYKARNIIVKSRTLTRLLKNNSLFNVFYEKFLTSKAPPLSMQDRGQLQSSFSREVLALKSFTGRIPDQWKDFITDSEIE